MHHAFWGYSSCLPFSWLKILFPPTLPPACILFFLQSSVQMPFPLRNLPITTYRAVLADTSEMVHCPMCPLWLPRLPAPKRQRIHPITCVSSLRLWWIFLRLSLSLSLVLISFNVLCQPESISLPLTCINKDFPNLLRWSPRAKVSQELTMGPRICNTCHEIVLERQSSSADNLVQRIKTSSLIDLHGLEIIPHNSQLL